MALEGGLEHDARKAVEPDELDEPLDVGLRRAQPQTAAAEAQPVGEGGEVEHPRGVGEGQLREIDDDVTRAGERARQRGATKALGRTIFVPPAPQNSSLCLEV